MCGSVERSRQTYSWSKLNHDIGGFDIAVDELHRVGVLKRFRDLSDKFSGFTKCETADLTQFANRNAFDKSRHDRRSFLQLCDFIDRHDSRMPKLCHRTRFSKEPFTV